MLLLGDARTFFMLYRVVADAGLRAYQLDRDGALTRAHAPPATLAAAAAAAASAANCVLATYEQIGAAGAGKSVAPKGESCCLHTSLIPEQ